MADKSIAEGCLKRKQSQQCDNTLRKLQRREVGRIYVNAFISSVSQERFRNFQLQEEFDTYERSNIVEIVVACGVIFALAESGSCAAFSRHSNKRLCLLNTSEDQEIRSLFYNNYNESLVTVSAYSSDNFRSLKCRTILIEYIRRGQPDAGLPLFESESLRWPGYIEFDNVNGKIVTLSAENRIYKVFDAKEYRQLYSICDEFVEEIKVGQSMILLIFKRRPNEAHVPLQIRSIEDGVVLKTFHHRIHPNKNIVFMDQFNENFLIKQEDENLQILDVRSGQLIEVSKTEFRVPSAVIFLHQKALILAFHYGTGIVDVWNLRGERVSSFQDMVWHAIKASITRDQGLILFYNVDHCDDGSAEEYVGLINVTKISTGKPIAQIRADDPNLVVSCRKKANGTVVQSTVEAALRGVTAVSYDEENNEIYTGNAQGMVHVWSN